ncbi:MAG: hypothetical protein ACK5QX_01000, partial [bacterium]
AALARSRSRYVRYTEIDAGGYRAAYNASINWLRPETEHDIWEAYDTEQQVREMDQLRSIHLPVPPEAPLATRRLLRRRRKLTR